MHASNYNDKVHRKPSFNEIFSNYFETNKNIREAYRNVKKYSVTHQETSLKCLSVSELCIYDCLDKRKFTYSIAVIITAFLAAYIVSI